MNCCQQTSAESVVVLVSHCVLYQAIMQDCHLLMQILLVLLPIASNEFDYNLFVLFKHHVCHIFEQRQAQKQFSWKLVCGLGSR